MLLRIALFNGILVVVCCKYVGMATTTTVHS